MDTLKDVLKEALQSSPKPLSRDSLAAVGCVAVLAETQSAGRGRRGRSWQSEKGNLFLSFSVPFEEESARCFEISFTAAVALERTIRSFCPTAELTLKWPNDILFQGKKLSGLLIEGYRSKEGFFLLVGVGVNLLSAPCLKGKNVGSALYETACLKDIMEQAQSVKALDPSTAAASLSESAPPPMLALVPTPEEFTTQFLSIFKTIEAERKKRGFSFVREKWLEKSVPPGTILTLSTDRGLISAPFLDLDGQGRLLLGESYETAKAFSTGDVFVPGQSAPERKGS